MRIPYYVVDAFSSRPFSGNPAGVCPLEKWLPDDVMQKIAAENNLSETAFFTREEDGFRLRWFAPAAEVDLCGHATLATAHVLYEFLGHKEPAIRFDTKSGPLTVERQGERLVMDFPALKMEPISAPADLAEGLGARPKEAFRSMDLVAVFDDPERVRRLSPKLDILMRLEGRGVIVTAPGKDCDYVLRCFGPKFGIPEDPVTGSAQSQIAPYWAKKLGKKTLLARQLSARGGELHCEDAGERVKIGGQAALYLKGEISV